MSAQRLEGSTSRPVASPAIAPVPVPETGRHVWSLSETAISDVPTQRGERSARHLQTSDTGTRVVRLEALERLEFSLEDPSGKASATCAGTWAGSVDQERLGHLPVGAAIDPTGTFYWQPGPGFKGQFELLFVRTACDGTKQRLPITVKIQSR